jgi:hypothetical protein
MRPWQKLLVTAITAPVLAVAGYVAYLAATYIDKVVTSGSAYGFEIGATKEQALTSAVQLSGHPNAVIYVSYGPRAGDHFSIAPSTARPDKLVAHDQWDVLLDGNGNFFNIVRLTFHNGHLVRIYRHRQNFELP